MKRPDKVKRGQLVFVRDGELLTCHLGDPMEGPSFRAESEHILTVHESLIADLIAGLTAMKRSR